MPIIEYDPNAGEQRGQLPAASNPFVVGGVRLLAGVNQVSEREWNTLLEHPAYKKAIAIRMDMRKIRIVQSPKKDAEPSIADFSLNDAVPMIQNCTDVELLQRWKGEDSRKGAQKAIAEQLAKLSPSTEQDKDDSDRTSPDTIKPNFDDMPVYT